jgi:hypothetical protein
MEQTQEHEHLAQPVEDLWAIDWRFGAVVQADCHHAEGVKDKEDVVIWLSRETLNKEQQAQFLQHLERLMSVRDWGEVECGVDAAQRGFVVLNHGSTKAIDFDAPGIIATRNRFLMCVMLISQIHEAGFACGNITPSSFVVDSLGNVRLIGFMGGYEEKVSSTIPLDIRPFFRVNGDTAGIPSAAADVYSLAVIGLKFFGAQFPPAAIDVQNMDEFLKRVDADAPPWVLSVLATIVREPKKQLCADANEMLRAISAKDTTYLEALKKQIEGQTVDADGGKPLSIDEIREMFITPEQLRKRRIDGLVRSLAFRVALFAVLGIAVFVVLALQGAGLSGIIPARMTSRAHTGQDDPTVDDVKNALAMLKGRGNPSAQIGVASGSAMGNSAGVDPVAASSAPVGVDVTIPKKITIAADNMILRHLERGDISPEERSLLFDLYGDCDDESKSLLASKVAKLGGDSERDFRKILIKQLQRSALMEQEALEKLSTDALFLGAEGRLSKQAAGVWGRFDSLSNDELWRLLRAHARKRSPVFSLLAEEVVTRHLAPPSKEIFLSVAAAAEPHSGAPYDVLLRGCTGDVTVADVHQLSAWADPLSLRALYAVLVSTSDPEAAASTLVEISAKPGVDSLVTGTIEALSEVHISEPAKVGKLIGGLGLVDGISEEMLVLGFESLRGNPAKGSVLAIALQRGNARVVEVVLRTFGKDMHPDLLIDLLERPEAHIRKAVIPFLTEVRISSSKARIRERYDAEQDPAVRHLYETVLYDSTPGS